MFPAGAERAAKVAFRLGAGDGDAEAVGPDQPRAVRAHQREQLAPGARAPSLPISAKPAEITTSARTPLRSACLGRAEHGGRRAG